MAVVKTEHTTISSLTSAIISAGFASRAWNFVGTYDYFVLELNGFPYGAMKVIYNMGSTQTSYTMTTLEYGSVSDSGVFTSQCVIKETDTNTNYVGGVFTKSLLYYDISAGWFAFTIMCDELALKSDIPFVSLIYQGKLTNGQNYSFISGNVGPVGIGGVIIEAGEYTGARWIAPCYNTLKSGNNYATFDLVVTANAELVRNGAGLATVVGLKWIGKQDYVTETEYGDTFRSAYLGTGARHGSILIPFT